MLSKAKLTPSEPLFAPDGTTGASGTHLRIFNLLPARASPARASPARQGRPVRQNGRVTSTSLTEGERAEREGALRELVGLMRPAVQADGGDLELVWFDVETGEVEVELRGACSSCAISAATLQGGVERILKARLDWVSEVRGGVDETEDPIVSMGLGRGAYVPKV